MLRIVSHTLRYSQNFMNDLEDGVDWGSEEQNDQFDLPDNQWENYIVDDVENTEDEEFSDLYQESDEFAGSFSNDFDYDAAAEPANELSNETPIDTQQELLPDGEQLESEEEIPNPYDLINMSMSDPPRLIKFDYTTKDGRFTTNRVVEPHRTFVASGTGNEILLTYDRTVGDIRGFIVGNIKPFGVLYKNTFTRRPEIMRERVPAMSSLTIQKQ